MPETMTDIIKSADQPELVNNLKVLYNREHNSEFDARGLPKVGRLREIYQDDLDTLFLATDKCYFLMGKSARIAKEAGDEITFEFTDTGKQEVFLKDKLHEMRNETFTEGNSIKSKFHIGHIGLDLFHKLESKTWSLNDPKTKKALLERYDAVFERLDENQFPSDQWGINSLFYMSILLDFDKDKQKHLAKYFINNCLNTLYREKDHHYGLHKSYHAQQIWDKIGISVKPIQSDVHKSHHTCLSPSDCKKIADYVGITAEEFSDILYDACMFKLGDFRKASASFHRKDSMLIPEIKPYLTEAQRKEVEAYEYIYKNDRAYSSGIYYHINRFERVQGLAKFGMDVHTVRSRLESDKNVTIITLIDEAIKKQGEGIYTLYKNHIFDIDAQKHLAQHKGNIVDGLFLVAENENLILTNNQEKYKESATVLGSVHNRISKGRDYDYEKDCPIYPGAKKYDVGIFGSEFTPKEILYSVIKILSSSDDIKLELYSLNFK